MDVFPDAYGFHTVKVRRVEIPDVGPCVDIGDGLTVTMADAARLATVLADLAECRRG